MCTLLKLPHKKIQQERPKVVYSTTGSPLSWRIIFSHAVFAWVIQVDFLKFSKPLLTYLDKKQKLENIVNGMEISIVFYIHSMLKTHHYIAHS